MQNPLAPVIAIPVSAADHAPTRSLSPAPHPESMRHTARTLPPAPPGVHIVKTTLQMRPPIPIQGRNLLKRDHLEGHE